MTVVEPGGARNSAKYQRAGAITASGHVSGRPTARLAVAVYLPRAGQSSDGIMAFLVMLIAGLAVCGAARAP